jgi:hypothetical protein
MLTVWAIAPDSHILDVFRLFRLCQYTRSLTPDRPREALPAHLFVCAGPVDRNYLLQPLVFPPALRARSSVIFVRLTTLHLFTNSLARRSRRTL